jgi:hypothetical protein
MTALEKSDRLLWVELVIDPSEVEPSGGVFYRSNLGQDKSVRYPAAQLVTNPH